MVNVDTRESHTKQLWSPTLRYSMRREKKSLISVMIIGFNHKVVDVKKASGLVNQRVVVCTGVLIFKNNLYFCEHNHRFRANNNFNMN